MRGFTQRATASLLVTCLLMSLAVLVVGCVGINGVRGARATDVQIARDELGTSQVTMRLSRSADTALVQGQAMLLDPRPANRARLAAQLQNSTIPVVDVAVGDLVRVHAGDAPAERADIATLADQWAAMRTVINVGATQPPVAAADELTSAYTPLSAHIDTLITSEDSAAAASEARAAKMGEGIILIDLTAVVLALLTAAGCARIGGRRIRRALEPAQDQVEFADTLQLADDENEAHQLLQRHLQRAVPGAVVTVLNRNNSADRLEAKTAMPADSPLVATLQHAEPRSCLAVRSGRIHDEDDRHPPLLGCPVCADCPGSSTCAPLTVGGEVIGSVLIQRDTVCGIEEQQRIRDSVGQAAPVLANLRNLAIAEFRAATDGLTGLPNKRAVTESLKRMLAQAARTLTPMALLMLDLDHFKNLNDTYGHPVGDQALSAVGAALRAVLRESDFAGRNGGEEFAVILPDADAGAAAVVAEKIRAAIADITLPGTGVTVTASLGLAAYPEHATNAERLERFADSALYVAKRGGRNRVEIATHTDPGSQALLDELATLGQHGSDRAAGI